MAAKIPRRRRTAEEARYEILAAAQRRLAEGGPEAIRLQDIARDLGISHPTILHHFESREGLMVALARSAMGALNEDILRALADPRRSASPEAVLERVYETLGESGHARLLAWSALTDRNPSPDPAEHQTLRVLTDAVYRRLGEEARAVGGLPPAREEADFVVRLVAVAMLGDALMGDVFNRLFGIADGSTAQRRFRAWLAHLVEDRLVRSVTLPKGRKRATQRGQRGEPPEATAARHSRRAPR